MEAMALLDGLTYIREELGWRGHVEWHSDSQSVIQSFQNWAVQSHPGTWERQSDKDVWDLLVQERQRWGDKLCINHVESHVNNKKDEDGNKRIPTPMQWMNIAVDKLADTGYVDTEVPESYISPTRRSDRYIIVKSGAHGGEITGKTRSQLREELLLDDTIEKATESPETWGAAPEHIDWRRMRKSLPTSQPSDTLFACKMLHAKLATNAYAHDQLGKGETNRCPLCNEHTETNAHMIFECTSNTAHNIRGELVSKLCALLVGSRTGSTPTSALAEWKSCMRNIYRGDATTHEHLKLTEGSIKTHPWMESWNKASKGEHRTEQEHLRSRMVEMILRCNSTYPIWTGVITLTWTWCMRWAGVPEQHQLRMVKQVRKLLLQHARTMWEARKKAIEDRPVATTVPVVQVNNQPGPRVGKKRQRMLFDYMTETRTANVRPRLAPTAPCINVDSTTQPLISSMLAVRPQTVNTTYTKIASEDRVPTPTLREFLKSVESKRKRKAKAPASGATRSRKAKATTASNNQNTRQPTVAIAHTAGIIRATSKQPQAEYIRNFRARIDGRHTTEVVGNWEYHNPNTKKTKLYGISDLKYYIKTKLVTVEDDSEQDEALTRTNTVARALQPQDHANPQHPPHAVTTASVAKRNREQNKVEDTQAKRRRVSENLRIAQRDRARTRPGEQLKTTPATPSSPLIHTADV
jgi:hypothetical protein